MAERGLMVDHTTICRWCQKYGANDLPMAAEKDEIHVHHRKRPHQAVIDRVDVIVSTTAALWTQPSVLVSLFGF